MTEFRKLKKHRKLYSCLRWLSKHPAWLHKLARWFHSHTEWLRKILRFVCHKMRWMKYLNPLRYIKRIDQYIIKKFIGTYIYSIAFAHVFKGYEHDSSLQMGASFALVSFISSFVDT